MNNKYLSGLLAGVLTAGVLQGSDGKENMPGLGGNQTPMTRAQSTNELPEELQELFLAFSQSLAEMGYQAQVNVNPIQMPNQITRITLGENSGMQSNEGVVDLPEMVLSKPEIPSTPAELTQLTFGENGEIKEAVAKGQNGKKTKLDPYSMQVATKYFESADDLHNVMMVNSKFKEQANRNRINHVPVTEKNQALFEYIQTQQIFGPNDYILPGMYQYIITYPVTRAEIEAWVNRLGNMHNGKAIQENGEKPIIVEYQHLHNYYNVDPILEKKDDIFKIKTYWVENFYNSISHYDFGQFYYGLKPYMGKKRIVFNKVSLDARKGIESSLDLTDVEIRSWKYGSNAFYDEYLIKKGEDKDDNLYFWNVVISGRAKPEEQRHRLKVLSMDKKVEYISGVYNTGYLNFEFLGNVKAGHEIDINPNLLQKPRSVAFGNLNSGIQIGNRKIYTFYNFNYNDDIVAEKVKEYVQYVKDNNLEYLSGFVNFAKKPNYLTDEEWRKVMDLTERVEELMNFVDQNFNEHEEANPYIAPAADPYGCGDNYGCDGYGCAGYNPYGQYYYGCGYGC